MIDQNNQTQNGYTRANKYSANVSVMQYGGHIRGGRLYGMHQNSPDIATLAYGFQGVRLVGQPFVNQHMNRFRSDVSTHSTRSPTSVFGPYGMATSKNPEQTGNSRCLETLTSQWPAIPRAIPAPSSPLKPLDRALENHRGDTNVYIRGLLPETTDEDLKAWSSRFGDIESSKSMIDLNTGLCKGYVRHSLSFLPFPSC